MVRRSVSRKGVQGPSDDIVRLNVFFCPFMKRIDAAANSKEKAILTMRCDECGKKVDDAMKYEYGAPKCSGPVQRSYRKSEGHGSAWGYKKEGGI